MLIPQIQTREYQIGILTPADLESMVRQADRYQYGAEQDNNIVIAFLHNSYAVADIDMAWELAAPDQITEEMVALRKKILAFQDTLQKRAEKLAKEHGIPGGALGVIIKCPKSQYTLTKPKSQQRWCLMTRDGEDLIGRHPTRAKAQRQERAIYAAKGRKMGQPPFATPMSKRRGLLF